MCGKTITDCIRVHGGADEGPVVWKYSFDGLNGILLKRKRIHPSHNKKQWCKVVATESSDLPAAQKAAIFF